MAREWHAPKLTQSDLASMLNVNRSSLGRWETTNNVPSEYDPITDVKGWTVRGGVVMIKKNYDTKGPNIEWDEGRYLKG